MHRDLRVHRRLRERRFVALVVAITAVADQIDEDVAPERHAIPERQARRVHARFGVVGVNVEDRNLEPAGHAAGVERAVGITGFGREANLVVGNDVDGAAGRVLRGGAG